MTWKDIERPGYFGRKRDDIIESLDKIYGTCNWRITWKWLGKDRDYSFACNLYEDAYYRHSFDREDIWKDLSNQACEVYDHEESDVNSGFNYNAQRGKATHLQDIAVRRVVARRGWGFQGKELIQIRSHRSYFGNLLSPGKVPFHLPQHIIPGLSEDLVDRISDDRNSFHVWWDKNSVEDFYQSNKYLQKRVINNKTEIPDLLREIKSESEDFERSESAYKRGVKAVKILLEPFTREEFARLQNNINQRLKGKAPKIKSFRADGNYVDLTLDCYEEELTGEEGDEINSAVKSELQNQNLTWISYGFSTYYYGK